MQHKEFILLNEKDQGEKVSINRLPIQIRFLKTVYSYCHNLIEYRFDLAKKLAIFGSIQIIQLRFNTISQI